jgi:hypothetical protein
MIDCVIDLLIVLVLDDMTSISFIKHLKQVTPAEREDELTKKISVSRDIIAKLLELVKNADKNTKDLIQQLNEGTWNTQKVRHFGYGASFSCM